MNCSLRIKVRNYDLNSTLSSGQSFRWQPLAGSWFGVVKNRSVRLRQLPGGILAETATQVDDWTWLHGYLQTDVDLAAIIRTFPQDEPMQRAVAACSGLRLLRQDEWECLASFILSSTKQIVQIQEIIRLLTERYGDRLPASDDVPAWSFPSPTTIADIPEKDLRDCKMGFRAPYLKATAQAIAQHHFSLPMLHSLPTSEARSRLLELPGVGRKIADCVLLFAFGRQDAFPVDVWVMKALRQFYFPRRRVSLPRLHRFAATHFGPFAGYAQQYLFHFVRLGGKPSGSAPALNSAT